MTSRAEHISRIAELIGEPARAKTLSALLQRTELTAAELAREAGLTQRAAVEAVARLTDSGLLQVRNAGNRRYCRIKDPVTAESLRHLIQSFGAIGGEPQIVKPAGVCTGSDSRLAYARVCHNHLAGRMGARMYRSLFMRGVIIRVDDALELTMVGRQFVEGFGISLDNLGWGHSQTTICRPCLNWSKQDNHMAGSLGGAFLLRIYAMGWAKREKGSSAVTFTPEGEAAFMNAFPVPG